jgi:hypothetical protein
MKSCLLVNYSYAMNDPVSRQAAASLADAGWQVDVFNAPPMNGASTSVPESVRVFECPGPMFSPKMGPLYRVAQWQKFRRKLQRWIETNRPELVATIMPHALDAGRLDSQIFRKG